MPDRITLEIDGRQIEGLSLKGALAVERPLVDGACGDHGICTGELRLALEELEATAASIVEKGRHDAAMATIQNIRALATELDELLGIGDLDRDGDLDKVFQPGQPHYGNITFERAYAGDKTLYAWFKDAADGQNSRKSISVIIQRKDGEPVARYNLFEAFPVAWSLSTENGVVEEIELAVEKVERAAITVNEEGVKKAQQGAILEADGEVVGTFALATGVGGAITWGDGVDDDCDGLDLDSDDDGLADGLTSCPSDRPIRCGDGACVAGALSLLDGLEEQAARAKHDIAMNAIRNMKALMPELEGNLAGARRPGRVKYADITLKRALGTDDPFTGWITDVEQGKPWKRSLSLVITGKNGKEVARFTMQGGPVRYALSGSDGHLVEEITFVAERLEMAN